MLSLRVWSLCSATRVRDSKRPAHRNEEWPPLAATRESPRTETKTQHSHKFKKKKKKIKLFVFLLNFKSSLYILYNSSLSDVSFANIFSQSMACLLILLGLSFTEQVLMKSSLSIISFADSAFDVVLKYHHHTQGQSCVLLCYFLGVL